MSHKIKLTDGYNKIVVDIEINEIDCDETINSWVRLFRSALSTLGFSQVVIDEYVPESKE